MPERPSQATYRRRRLVALGALLLFVVLVVAVVSGGGDDSGGAESASEELPPWLPEEPTRLTIAASGDLLIHSPVFFQALANGGGATYDFKPMLTQVREIVREADVGICHLEEPLTDGEPHGEPTFMAPASLAGDIKWVGWDVCSNASNHSYDAGEDGVRFTIKKLDQEGIAHSGTNARPGTSRAAIVKAKGLKVALLAYTTKIIGMGDLEKEFLLNMADPKTMLADAKAARKAGASVVIVSVHWGDEYVHEPSDLQRSLARELTASPNVDAVIGQHVHVVQPIRRVNGKPVVYGEGNLLSNQTAACCPPESQDGMVVLLDVVAGPKGVKVERVRYVPTWVQHPGFEVIRSSGESRDRTIGYAGQDEPWLVPEPAPSG